MRVLNNVRTERGVKSGGGESRREMPVRIKRTCGYCSVHAVVGERSIRGEVRAKALVDCMEVRMPE